MHKPRILALPLLACALLLSGCYGPWLAEKEVEAETTELGWMKVVAGPTLNTDADQYEVVLEGGVVAAFPRTLSTDYKIVARVEARDEQAVMLEAFIVQRRLSEAQGGGVNHYVKVNYDAPAML